MLLHIFLDDHRRLKPARQTLALAESPGNAGRRGVGVGRGVSGLWILIAFLWATASNQVPVRGQTPPRQAEGLQITWKERYLEVTGSMIPGGPIRTHYLEAYCRPGSTDREWKKTVIPHQSRLVSASSDHKRIEIEDRLDDGVIVTHQIEAGADEVSFLVTATNPTSVPSQAHWAQPCMRVDGFTGMDPKDAREVYPPYIQKCFIMVDGKLTRLPTKPWATEARYVPGQVYAAAGVNRDDVNPRPLSQIVPSSGLTGCFSADEKMILAVAWEPCQEIFQGVITCIHNDFRIGGLQPGETKRIRGKMYLLAAEPEKLLERFEADFQRFED